MSVQDICDLNSLLQVEESDTEQLQRELEEVDGEIEVQEKRFEQEVNIYHEKTLRKDEINEDIKRMLEKTEVIMLKLDQESHENRNSTIFSNFSERVSSYIQSKDELINEIETIQRNIMTLEDKMNDIGTDKNDTLKNEIEISHSKIDNLYAALRISQQNLAQQQESYAMSMEDISSHTILTNTSLTMHNNILKEILQCQELIKTEETSYTVQKQEFLDKLSSLHQQLQDISDANRSTHETLTELTKQSDLSSNELQLHQSQTHVEEETKDQLLHELQTISSTINHEKDAITTKTETVRVLEAEIDATRHQLALCAGEIESQVSRAESMLQQQGTFGTGEDVKLQIAELKKNQSTLLSQMDIIKSQMEKAGPGPGSGGPLTDLLQQIEDCSLRKQVLLQQIQENRLATENALKDIEFTVSNNTQLVSKQSTLQLQLQIMQQKLETGLNSDEHMLSAAEHEIAISTATSQCEVLTEQLAAKKAQKECLMVTVEQSEKDHESISLQLQETQVQVGARLALELDAYLTKYTENRAMETRQRLLVEHSKSLEEIKNTLKREDEEFQADFLLREEKNRQLKLALVAELHSINMELEGGVVTGSSTSTTSSTTTITTMKDGASTGTLVAGGGVAGVVSSTTTGTARSNQTKVRQSKRSGSIR
eukprot:gene2692-5302_t